MCEKSIISVSKAGPPIRKSVSDLKETAGRPKKNVRSSCANHTIGTTCDEI